MNGGIGGSGNIIIDVVLNVSIDLTICRSHLKALKQESSLAMSRHQR